CIAFFTLCRDFRLSWSPFVQFGLYKIFVDGNIGGAAVNNNANRFSMRFAISHYFKKLAKLVSCHDVFFLFVYLFACCSTLNPCCCKWLQKSGYDFSTTSGSLIVTWSKTNANGANAIAIR